MDTRPSFDKTAIHSVELNLLDGQVDLILRSLELFSYNLEFMLNAEESDEEKLFKIFFKLSDVSLSDSIELSF